MSVRSSRIVGPVLIPTGAGGVEITCPAAKTIRVSGVRFLNFHATETPAVFTYIIPSGQVFGTSSAVFRAASVAANGGQVDDVLEHVLLPGDKLRLRHLGTSSTTMVGVAYGFVFEGVAPFP